MGSVIVGIIVAAIIAAIVLSMRSDRKKGKHSCGGTCGGCPNACNCHAANKTQKEILKITKPLYKEKRGQLEYGCPRFLAYNNHLGIESSCS